jgi:glycosyltransferase involved in cell wall biosynthesis
MSALLGGLRRRLLAPGIARAAAGRGAPRRALLLYTVRAFAGPAPRVGHQNLAQQRELARALAGLGHEVDVVDFDERRRALLRHDYDLVLDLHPVEHPLYEGRLRPGARRIAYMTGSEPDFANAAERTRLADLAGRRGVHLEPRRQCAPFPRGVLESFDAFFYFGDDATLATYAAHRLPPTQRLPNHGYDDVEPTDPARRDPRRFLFLGGNGQVHKGLDLLLEVFAAEPGLELIVVSPFAAERDFARAYRRELRHTPAVRAIGVVDVRSARFRALQAGCGTLILPSCSEGQAGSVTAALSFGMPCVVSPACGFDEREIAVLPDCRLETLRRVVRERAAQPRERVIADAAASLALLGRSYRPAHYAAAVSAALRRVLGAAPEAPASGPARAPETP